MSNRAVRDLLAEFDRAFAAGDADALSALFADDAQLLLLYSEPMVGGAAIAEHWHRLFARFDASAWQTDHTLVEVDGSRAHALVVYSETLVSRETAPSRLVNGRITFFFRREDDGTWRISLVMNSHIRPVEEQPPAS